MLSAKKSFWCLDVLFFKFEADKRQNYCCYSIYAIFYAIFYPMLK